MKQKDDNGAWRSYLAAFRMEKDTHDFLGIAAPRRVWAVDNHQTDAGGLIWTGT